MDLVLGGTMVRLVTPTAVELSILDGCTWLRPTHFNEGLMEGDHFLGCVVESAKFGFGGGRLTNFIIWEIERTRPLCLGKGSFFGDEDVGTSSTAAL
jgi:hypothetical protein